MTDPTTRFSARSGDYARTRPSYPRAVLDVLRGRAGLSPRSVVADLGSGTGIFTRLLLESGAVVHAVEPNDDMRAVAERDLGALNGFRSVAGRAEATTLPAASVDLVAAAQAFHWFDVPRTRAEIARILRPDGRVALVWNDRRTEADPFSAEYESLLVRSCPGYRELQGKSDAPATYDLVFGAGRWSRAVVPNQQELDRDGLVGRVMSASYAPPAGSDGHAALVDALHAAFDRHASDGCVVIAYDCVVIHGAPATPEARGH